MAKEVKLKDIAERAGVSIATVSMVLSGKGKISPEVSDRILAISDQLEYRRAGSGGDRRLAFRYVTILHGETYSYSWNFSYALISNLESILIEKGYYPLVIHLNEMWQLATIVDEIKANRSGAIFTIDCATESAIPQLAGSGVPLIVINNANFQDLHSCVLADDVEGAREGTARLLAAGHRRIVFAEYERSVLPAIVRDRGLGFRQALEEAGVIPSPDLHIKLPLMDQTSLDLRVAELFKPRSRPTAIFAHDDYYAACIIGSLRKLGLGVPFDVSIVAPGDVLDYSQPFLPSISTMRIDIELMARMAVEIMMTSILRKGREPVVIKTKLHFIDRGSIRRALP